MTHHASHARVTERGGDVAIVGAAAHRPEAEPEPEPELLVLSAPSAATLEAATALLADHLERRPEQPLHDVAFTLRVDRAEFAWRRAVVSRTSAHALTALRAPASPGVHTSLAPDKGRPVAFMFPGIGDQYPGMGRDLYREQPAFAGAVDECAEYLIPQLGLDLRDLLYADDGGRPLAGVDIRALVEGRPADTPLDETAVAHPALFITEYAVAQLLLSFGLRPAAAIGHSLGEYVAATIAGVLRLEDALTLVAKRAALIADLAPGAMLAVPLPAAEVASRGGPDVSVALVNGPRLTVAAGALTTVDAFEQELSTAGIPCKRLATTHAFHSPLMKPIVPALTTLAESLDLAAPTLPYISNLTGSWATAELVTDPTYWGRHMASTVHFDAGLELLCRNERQILLEVGPGQTMSTLAMFKLAARGAIGEAVVVPSLSPSHDRRQSDTEVLLDCLGRVWAAGGGVDLATLRSPARARLVDLPTYPFDSKAARER